MVCLDHFHVESVKLFHAMDSATHYSAALVVESTALSDAIYTFGTCLLSHFWIPDSRHADKAFHLDGLREFLSAFDSSLRPVPPRQYKNNLIKPHHGVIRSIFLQLKDVFSSTSLPKLAICAVPSANDLYRTDTLSAFDMEKVFTKPIIPASKFQPVTQYLLDAQEPLKASRTLMLIVRSSSLPYPKYLLLQSCANLYSSQKS